jgi:hypothetical protein
MTEILLKVALSIINQLDLMTVYELFKKSSLMFWFIDQISLLGPWIWKYYE